jgi:hypothetical protein
MIRAVKTGAKPDVGEMKQYEELISAWSIKPALAERINLN